MRFNPDSFVEDGAKRRVMQKERHQKLLEAIDYKPSKQFEITYLYYDRSDRPIPDVCFDPDYSEHLRALVHSKAV